MAFEHNDIATKNRLMSGLGEELMGYEHNDIVTVDVMEKAIAEGGGGGDFSTAEVTIINNTNNDIQIANDIQIVGDSLGAKGIATVGTDNITAVLYKNMNRWEVSVGTVTVSGSATIATSPFGTGVIITGDCTITIS